VEKGNKSVGSVLEIPPAVREGYSACFDLRHLILSENSDLGGYVKTDFGIRLASIQPDQTVVYVDDLTRLHHLRFTWFRSCDLTEQTDTHNHDSMVNFLALSPSQSAG
jgi:hypothetical protein